MDDKTAMRRLMFISQLKEGKKVKKSNISEITYPYYRVVKFMGVNLYLFLIISL
jgi:hypothetical protein